MRVFTVEAAMLGDLLLPTQPKYAMMELSVAVWLDPDDLASRRLLPPNPRRLQMASRGSLAAPRHLYRIAGRAARRKPPRIFRVGNQAYR